MSSLKKGIKKRPKLDLCEEEALLLFSVQEHSGRFFISFLLYCEFNSQCQVYE